MPYRNSIKQFKADTTFHVYACGINKMEIFRGDEDFIFFIHLLKKYLTKDFKERRIVKGLDVLCPVNSVFNEVELYAYCLLPKHLHLILKNLADNGISALARRVLTNYSIYFNEKYDRDGSIIQGVFRAVPILTEEKLVYVGKYIHANPVKSGVAKKVKDYKYSSYANYLTNESPSWLLLHPALTASTKWGMLDSMLSEIKEDISQGIFVN
jgi:putative transposase